ncbi:hypothetical protein X737_28105 [Mesorhizobium sp. L48C026A00]|nr:hypothetical protein X737_28105 [Mesorhizobium sp. L48C026A00]
MTAASDFACEVPQDVLPHLNANFAGLAAAFHAQPGGEMAVDEVDPMDCAGLARLLA